MRVIETKVYTYEELSNEAKEKAIESQREQHYRYNDFGEWAIDDCYLLNPPYDEIEDNCPTFKGQDGLLIGNTRTLYFSLDRDRYIDVSKAMIIHDEESFFKWLGFTKNFLTTNHIEYKINTDNIEIFRTDNLNEDELQQIHNAEMKFRVHCYNILKNIEETIDWNFTDEAILEHIEINDVEFKIDGTIY